MIISNIVNDLNNPTQGNRKLAFVYWTKLKCCDDDKEFIIRHYRGQAIRTQEGWQYVITRQEANDLYTDFDIQEMEITHSFLYGKDKDGEAVEWFVVPF